jgi:putative protein-disulfide isomerase
MTDISSADHGNGDGLHFIYFADPMCSWCYGFTPVIRALAQQFEGRLPVRLVMGGLRAGNTKAMTEKDREYIRGAWTRVGEASGQPFDFAFFDREHFVYDTEPACRAVVTMRRLAPEKALAFKARVSQAFYGENRDTTDVKVLAALAPEFEIDAERFELEMLSADARNETFRDFLTSQQAGVQGFPLLAAGSEDGGYALVTNGFRPLDGLAEAIESWLTAGAPVRPATQQP